MDLPAAGPVGRFKEPQGFSSRLARVFAPSSTIHRCREWTSFCCNVYIIARLFRVPLFLELRLSILRYISQGTSLDNFQSSSPHRRLHRVMATANSSSTLELYEIWVLRFYSQYYCSLPCTCCTNLSILYYQRCQVERPRNMLRSSSHWCQKLRIRVSLELSYTSVAFLKPFDTYTVSSR
jgi:hypothetical protein